MIISCKKDDDCLAKCKNEYKECIKNAKIRLNSGQLTQVEFDLAKMQCDNNKKFCFKNCGSTSGSAPDDSSYDDYDNYDDYSDYEDEDEDEDEYCDEGDFSDGDEYSDEG